MIPYQTYLESPFIFVKIIEVAISFLEIALE